MKRKKQFAIIRCTGSAALSRPDGGAGACAFGCLGCGACVAACPERAITLSAEAPAGVNRTLCIGCGECVKVCPQQIIELVPAENTIQPLCSSAANAKETKAACDAGCIGCRICARVCPAGAIRVENGHAVIRQDLCIACGMCAVNCPRGVIRDATGIFTAKL